MLPLYKGVDNNMKFMASEHNGGLWYDKFVNSWENNDSKLKKLDWIKTVTGTLIGDGNHLEQHSKRLKTLAENIGGQAITLKTATRFATGLGREHPVEIGFAWHHTLGTPYLPGSSVKGLLRAYVREWVKPETAVELFGQDDAKKEPCVGKWIFFDAIPTNPVMLEADVMTPHYTPYYEDVKGKTPPGDWHAPVPIPFLAVARQQKFQFAFAPRNKVNPGKHGNDAVTNETISQWLCSALYWLGAGAKTNSGFGVFCRDPVPAKPDAMRNDPQPQSRLVFDTTLELVTPAFFAGADQNDAKDCDLRPATLRGQLRYWWRTMHAGYLTVDKLRNLEAALWGSTNGAGAIRVVVERQSESDVVRYDKAKIIKMRSEQKTSDLGIPNSDPNKTTQGLWYSSFGMDETKDRGRPTEVRKQRFCLLPGAKWSVTIIVRSVNSDSCLTLDQILNQAKAALWLLCEFGGVGSKARKGFGSLKTNNLGDWSRDECDRVANDLRAACCKFQSKFTESLIESPALGISSMIEQSFKWSNIWAVLDQIGFAYQAFAKTFKHRNEKQALGLPHRIGSPTNGDFNPTGPVTAMIDQAQRLHRPDNVRHASPIHIHVSRESGRYTVRVLTLPAAFLPNLETSRSFLAKFLETMNGDMRRRSGLGEPRGFNALAAAHDTPRVTQAAIPELSYDQLKTRLTQLKPGEVLVRTESNGGGPAEVKGIFKAPATQQGISNVGPWVLDDAPILPANVTVVVLSHRDPTSSSKKSRFIEVIGRLPQPGGQRR